jgi:leader peptidase (prepilin peptidase)/N-methyltransferase
MIRILGTIFAGLLGLAFGSFLNVCLSRWPAGESIVRPRSHCRQCNRTLAWWENVPLLSWLALRGRCRTCRAWIGWRYPLVELAVGGLWARQTWEYISDQNLDILVFNFSHTLHSPERLICLVGLFVFPWILVALAVLDAETLWLPNWLTLPGILMGYICTVSQVRIIYDMERTPPLTLGLLGGFYPIIAAAALILLIRWLYWLIRRREGIGLGDAKLMALLAAWLGLPGALLSFGIGIVLGALVAIVLLIVPSARRASETWATSKLPLGTFLCIGGIVSSLWGQPILSAYLRWAGF